MTTWVIITTTRESHTSKAFMRPCFYILLNEQQAKQKQNDNDEKKKTFIGKNAVEN